MRKWNHAGREVPEVSEAEHIARYSHLVEVLPSSITLKAHAVVFTDLSVEQRNELLDRLRPFVSEARPDGWSEEPDALAALLSSVELRDAMMHTGIAGVVASRFVQSAPVVTYFSAGAGSLSIDEQPSWVSDLVHHESVPLDAATMNHKAGIDFKLFG